MNSQTQNKEKKKSFFCRLINKFKSNNNIIAVVNLSGIIGKVGKFENCLDINKAEPLLIKAFDTKKLKAVAININSPGGSPVQSELIYQRIRELSEEKKIPVFTFAQDVAASGGYFLALAGDEIYAHDASIIGSIGVISAGFGFEKAIKKFGVSRRVYAQGKNKSILDPFLKEDKESIEILNNAQKDVHESFKLLVRNRRSGKLNQSEEELFNGAFWSGITAARLGLIDKVGSMRSIMKEKYGDKIKFTNIEVKKKGIMRELFSQKLDNFNSSLTDNIVNKIIQKSYFDKFGL